jgi:site-specific DNA recombinase
MGLYSFLAQYEAENCSLRIKTALNTIAKSGFYKGSIAPYGYTIVDKILIIRDDDTPNIVKRIYKEYQEGKGIDTIARHLTRDNIPTPAQIANKKMLVFFGLVKLYN